MQNSQSTATSSHNGAYQEEFVELDWAVDAAEPEDQLATSYYSWFDEEDEVLEFLDDVEAEFRIDEYPTLGTPQTHSDKQQPMLARLWTWIAGQRLHNTY